MTWLEPTTESWNLADRESARMVTDPAGEVSGTLEDADRC